MRGDFQELFDIGKLDEQRLGEIEFILNSPAYEHTFKPYLLSILHTLNGMWKDRTQERKNKYPDEFLAGGAIFGEGLLSFFDKIIQETRMERIHASQMNASVEQQYDVRRHRGELKPVVGLDQPVLPGMADPDEF